MAVVTFCNRGLERKGGTHPCFLSKSAEIVENKRVDLFVSAKKCKKMQRVRKSLKRQKLVFGNPVTGPLRLRELALTGSVAGLGEKRGWASGTIRNGSTYLLERQLVPKKSGHERLKWAS